jgi:hypothetical protein
MGLNSGRRLTFSSMPLGAIARSSLASTDAPESKTFSDGTVHVKDARGSAQLTRLGPGALLYVCTGFLDTSFYEPMVQVAQREIDAAGDVAMFVDGWHLRSVDTGFREAWTVWFKANRDHFHMQLLVRTKLMEMAASLANLFTGVAVIKTYSNVRSWERACTDDFRGFQRHYPATG